MIKRDEPLAALLSSRPAFGMSSEAHDLVSITDGHLGGGTVTWLEVGAGDGRNLRFQLDRLSKNRRIVATALEPAAVSSRISDGTEWITSRSEDYRSDQRFDWISVRHSGYYLVDPIAEIQRLVGMLSDRGVLALTHWSRRCILHRLHLELCRGDNTLGCAGIEDIAEEVSTSPRTESLGLSLHDADLDVPRILADDNLARALYALSCRGRPALDAFALDPVGTIGKLLKRLPDARVRRNGILLIRARRP